MIDPRHQLAHGDLTMNVGFGPSLPAFAAREAFLNEAPHAVRPAVEEAAQVLNEAAASGKADTLDALADEARQTYQEAKEQYKTALGLILEMMEHKAAVIDKING